MEIKVSNGKIVVTESEPNEEFSRALERLEYLAPNFYGYKERYTRLRKVGKTYTNFLEADRDYRYLWGLISLAEEYEVNVAQEVKDELKRIRAEFDRTHKEYHDAEREAAKRKHWQYLQKYGCDGCKNLCMHTDVFYCRKTGKELETKRQPKFDGWTNTYYLFNLEPFPSADCPLKAE